MFNNSWRSCTRTKKKKKEKKKKEYGSKDPIKSETKELKLNQSNLFEDKFKIGRAHVWTPVTP